MKNLAPELTPEQAGLIEKYFREFEKDTDFKEEMAAREQHRKSVAEMLERTELEKMTEIEFGKLISKLWASRMWVNKDYLVKKIIDDNGGIDNIRKQLNDLLYGEDVFEKRFERFSENVKGLGPSSLTEILCLFDPRQYGIWNDKARKALKELKFDYLPLSKYRISGEEYVKINRALLLIAKKLQDLGLKDADLLAVDYLLYEIWYRYREKEAEIGEEVAEEEFDHEEVKEKVREIGECLGFEAETEKLIAKGAQVDVIWTAKIANLGVVRYVFEIHNRGSIDSLILNLQRASTDPTVQKIIAVSDKNQLEKIRSECEGLAFPKDLIFWNVSDVIKTHEKLSEAIQSIRQLGLVRSQFE